LKGGGAMAGLRLTPYEFIHDFVRFEAFMANKCTKILLGGQVFLFHR
jgi:hypothetical protein